MAENDDRTDESVSVSVELNGGYDDVVEKLRDPSAEPAQVGAIAGDLAAVLETVRELEGGTRSAVAGALPEDVAVAGNPEAVVDALQLLHRYDLVHLEGNTWTAAPSG